MKVSLTGEGRIRASVPVTRFHPELCGVAAIWPHPAAKASATTRNVARYIPRSTAMTRRFTPRRHTLRIRRLRFEDRTTFTPKGSPGTRRCRVGHVRDDNPARHPMKLLVRRSGQVQPLDRQW